MTANVYDSKITANIDNETYRKVMNYFHYGQRTIFFRKIFESLSTIIDNNKFNDVADYLYKGTDLNLPGKRE